MKLIDYTLEIGKRRLFDRVNIEFKNDKINHLLGSNGVGKSCFAKSTIGILNYSGNIEINNEITIIGSYTGIPQDFKIDDIKNILEKRYSKEHVNQLSKLLNIDDIPHNIYLHKMSDGQKQKLKLLMFLAREPKIIILDEFTTALDKRSSIDIYKFLNEYIRIKKSMIVNITHNLSDIEHMPGIYYYIKDKKIIEIDSKEQIIDMYVKGV